VNSKATSSPVFDEDELRLSADIVERLTLAAVIPLFGSVSFVQECLESIADQTQSFDEVILIDDANSDPELSDLCDRVCNLHGWKLLVAESAVGIVSATRIGIEASTCEYIALIDCDDLLVNNAVETLRPVIERERPSLLSTRYRVFSAADEEPPEQPTTWELRHVYRDDRSLGLEHLFLSHLKVARRTFLLEEGVWANGTDGVQDWFMATSAIQSDSYFVLDEPLYLHRIHASQTTHTARSHFLRLVNDKRGELLGKARERVSAEAAEDLMALGRLLRSTVDDLSRIPCLAIGRDEVGLFAIPASIPLLEICISERKPAWLLITGFNWIDLGALSMRCLAGPTVLALAISTTIPSSIHMATWYTGYLDALVALDPLASALVDPFMASNCRLVRTSHAS
jgi:glycosyltransferase involved in cell wall biosynthesis